MSPGVPIRIRPTIGLPLLVVLLLVPGCGDDEPSAAPVYAQDGSLVGRLPTPVAKRNLVLVLLDAVGREALEPGTGEDDGPLPALAALARSGVSFAGATASASAPVPSVASVLTGLHPTEHGCLDGARRARLVPADVTYVEILRRAFGFETVCIGDLPLLADAGFETVLPGGTLEDAATAVRRIGATRDAARPLLLVVHATEAAAPYRTTPAPTAPPNVAALSPKELLRLALTSQTARDTLDRRRPGWGALAKAYAYTGFRAAPDASYAADLKADWRRGLSFLDDGVDALRDALRGAGLSADTLFAVAGTHGDAFGAHGLIGHGMQLDEDLVGVPLFLSGPPPFDRAQVVPASVGLIDVLPTFFAWIGAPDPPAARGRSLLPAIESGRGRAVLSEAVVTPTLAGSDERRILASVRDRRFAYGVEYDVVRGRITERLFELERDPGATRDRLQDGTPLSDFPLGPEFCRLVELARDRVFGAADSFGARAQTPYSAGVATVEAPRPPACTGR